MFAKQPFHLVPHELRERPVCTPVDAHISAEGTWVTCLSDMEKFADVKIRGTIRLEEIRWAGFPVWDRLEEPKRFEISAVSGKLPYKLVFVLSSAEYVVGQAAHQQADGIMVEPLTQCPDFGGVVVVRVVRNCGDKEGILAIDGLNFRPVLVAAGRAARLMMVERFLEGFSALE